MPQTHGITPVHHIGTLQAQQQHVKHVPHTARIDFKEDILTFKVFGDLFGLLLCLLLLELGNGHAR